MNKGASISKEREFRRDIQVLRGTSVLAVVLFHADKSHFPLGYLGVDVFFVISGFVVTPMILRIFTDQVNVCGGGVLSSLKIFYTRRFYRLAPALATTLAISAALIFLLGPIGDFGRFAQQGIATLLILGNFGAIRYSGDYFSSNPNPLVHTWSLSVEEQIYIFLPIVLILILRNRDNIKKTTAFVLGVISALSFMSFLFPTILEPLYSRAGIESAHHFSFYSPMDRVWQFAVGGIAFLLQGRYQNRLRKIPKIFNLLFVILIVIILFGPFQIDFKISSILATTFALILIIFKSLDGLPNFLNKRLEWVGDRSYSIYLVHMPLLWLAKYSPLMQIGTNGNRTVQSAIAMVASLLLGALNYEMIEVKYRHKGKKESTKTRLISVFASSIVGPIILLFLLSGFVGVGSTSMDVDRLDDGRCKFWIPTLDDGFYSRFLNCHSKFGSATVVLGDSHAMNIYNSLFLKTKSEFYVGIAAAGCRPNTQQKHCPYDDFEELIKELPNTIRQVYFHQSGSYLIADKQGNVDSKLAFKSKDTYRIVDSDIQFLIRFLNVLGENVATTWIGPFPELRLELTAVQAKLNLVQPNPFVERAFLDLEKQINFYLKNQANTFRYVSLNEILGNKQFTYKDSSCIVFRDVDHWSKCGEEIFSLQISESLNE